MLTARDMTEETKEAGYLPVTRLVLSDKGGYPELEKKMAQLFADPEMLKRVSDEWDSFAKVYAENPELMRFPYYRIQEIRNKLQDLQRQPIVFNAAEGYDPNRQLYISSDEIDKLLRGNQDYRLSVYSFFAMHTDSKEREKHLKAYHGEYSGSHSGKDDITYTAGKSVSFSRGSLTEPYAKVHLNWNQVTKRVTAMIRENRFLTDEDRVAMPDYEMKQLARAVHGFSFTMPPRNFQDPIHITPSATIGRVCKRFSSSFLTRKKCMKSTTL